MSYSSVIYDGTWNGLLTAIFEIYEYKLSSVSIQRKDFAKPDFFGGCFEVKTDDKKAQRIQAALKRKISIRACHNIFNCFLSEIPGVEDTILNFIQLIFSNSQSVEDAYGQASVLNISRISKMVHREKHRMEAFIRFKLMRDEIYFASIEPDFNVIPLLVSHFKKRYADQKWVIYDLKRRYGIYYNLDIVEEITLDFSRTDSQDQNLIFDPEEELYQTLWKDYFKSANIASRKNTRLHLQHVPRRYWKHLVEKK